MIVQDNVLKEYLKNVYFITGTPCGGKTTISRELAKRHNLMVFDIDEQFANHQKLSNPEFQPAMNKQFLNADEFFGRTVEEYKQWLVDNTREQLDFVLLDLIRLSGNQIVLCDCHLTVEEADKLTAPSRIVFLIKDPSLLVEEYCNRPDHQGFSNFIHSASDVEKAKATCNETLKSLNEKRLQDVKNSNYFWLERTEHSTVEDTVRKVEQHFGFGKKGETPAEVEVRKVEQHTELAEKLIDFVEHFSWEDVKERLLQMLRSWAFTDWETMFVAMAEGLGFEKTYIPSEHIGLYEKYGYRYLKDIVNYGGGTDRLYVKELK